MESTKERAKRIIDNDFFNLIGVDVRNYSSNIQRIKREYGIIKLEANNERENCLKILQKCFEGKYEEKKDTYRKKMMTSVCHLDNYERDFDIARFMLVGSYLSDMEEIVPESPEIPFFSVAETRKRSTWCKAYQDVFTKDVLKHIFEDNDLLTEYYYLKREELSEVDIASLGRKKIAKYSYKRMEKIKQELKRAVLQIKARPEEREAYYATEEHIESYLLLDITLGVSLTAIIYHYMRYINDEEFNKCENIIVLLARIKCFSLRNWIAKAVFSSLAENNYSEKIIEDVEEDLHDILIRVNKAYMDMLCIKWRAVYKYDFKDFGEEQIKCEYIGNNVFGICKSLSNEFDEEITKDMEEEFGIISLPEELDYEKFLKMLKVRELENYGKSLSDIKSDYQKEMREEQDIRRNTKVKTRSVLYCKIHEIVVMQGIIWRE